MANISNPPAAAPLTDAASDRANVIDRLVAHRMLGTAPRHELDWLAVRGTLRSYERGEVLVGKGEVPPDFQALWVVLSGLVAIYVDRGAGPKKVMEWGAGDVSGMLPYSRTVASIGQGIAVEATEMFVVYATHFPEMIRECPSVTTTLVHAMIDRARAFTSSDLHDEKMLSLGKLSAGLAHELNNPASAAVRGAANLDQVVTELGDASRAVGAASLSPEALAVLQRFRDACGSGDEWATLSPIDRADREEAIADWIESAGADRSCAVPLAEAGWTTNLLDQLAASLEKTALAPAVRWLAAECTARALIAEVRRSASRIYELVNSVKRFTYMDRSSPETVDVAQGLRDTVTLMQSKARDKGVALTLEVAPGLPPVRGIGGDLNQIWSNLIDNALDAAPHGGHVWVSASRGLNTVVVRIIDDGSGVPPELIGRIFDPFFTTKPVGQGLGLGLDIAHRLARRQGADIEVESGPTGGRTEFRVTIPASRHP